MQVQGGVDNLSRELLLPQRPDRRCDLGQARGRRVGAGRVHDLSGEVLHGQ